MHLLKSISLSLFSTHLIFLLSPSSTLTFLPHPRQVYSFLRFIFSLTQIYSEKQKTGWMFTFSASSSFFICFFFKFSILRRRVPKIVSGVVVATMCSEEENNTFSKKHFTFQIQLHLSSKLIKRNHRKRQEEYKQKKIQEDQLERRE